MQFARSPLGQFMASLSGRLVRVAAGVLLIALGWIVVDSPWNIVLIAAGFVPLLAGAFDVCVVSLLLGGPFFGEQVRATRTDT